MNKATLDRLLSAIERRELRSLNWGYVDGSLAYEDVLGLFQEAGLGNEDDCRQAVDVLKRRSLLLEEWVAGSTTYRSRFAETVRLLVRLRQVMPTKPWDTAPNLVSDYRVTTRPRLVPKREVKPGEVIEAWSRSRRWDDARSTAATAYLKATGSLLSRFQVDVGTAVFDGYGRTGGVVVTAGTGAGKTLAYYLPVAIEIAQLTAPGSYWTKSVSLYPRVELLKDQMSDVYRIVRNVGKSSDGGRAIRLGALFEAVTNDASGVAAKWRRSRQGFVCPFLRCPDCDADLVWYEADLRAKQETLHCVSCGLEIGTQGEVGLTRESLKRQPPDLLFVSAEMVNQRLSDPSFRSLLGIQRDRHRRARYLLLDEIHTYGGTNGAQVGGVLRRYRHAVGSPMQVVGLSATLRDAPEFLAELTGVPAYACREFSPAATDLAPTSASYDLVLKAASSNRTSVLSTTIQSAFLLARMLDDERAKDGSDGFYGSRLFVFLDTLDVTNRLYDDLRDAEGILYTSGHGPLAELRPPLGPGEDRHRDREGQAWGAPDRIHGPLGNGLRVSRTSSQDAGVDAQSEIVVATPSLEVGFNDPRVGGVLQHRGPRDLATFVQRRGRAGRPIEMRPWMVTVLSEYGRDRLQFQLFEQLFEPTLPARHLPSDNRYVQRIQATLALMDWLSGQVRDPSPMWLALSGPAEWPKTQRTQDEILAILDGLSANDGRLVASLSKHVRRALSLHESDLQALLWLAPRSLLGEVIPTLRRRLATAWRTPGGSLDHHERWHPLPDFIPRALFQDLLVPEVRLLTQDDGRDRGAETWLAVAQALREFAPGRVSRRLAVHSPTLSHWVTPAETISIAEWMPDHEVAGRVQVGTEHLPLYRPWSIATSEVPRSISKSSYGSLAWRTTHEPIGDGAGLRLPRGATIAEPFERFDFFLHARGEPVTITRYATGSKASVATVRGQSESVTSTFVDADGHPCAVGFVSDVDGLRVRLNVPHDDALVSAVTSPEAAGWRTAYVRHRVTTDPLLNDRANSFERAWIADAVLLAIINAGLDSETGDPMADVLDDLWAALRSSIKIMHGSSIGPETDELAPTPTDDDSTDLEGRLLAFIDDEAILEGLETSVRAVISVSGDDLAAWARKQYVDAAGATVLAAASALLPNRAGAETLVLDTVDDGDSAYAWISETILGGGGVIEAIAEAFAADPWRLARSIEATIGTSDGEFLSGALARSVSMLHDDPEAARSGREVRGSSGHDERVAALRQFAAYLTSRGVIVDQSLLVALNQRIFRTGSDARLDEVLAALDAARSEVAERTRLWPELRLFALATSSSSAFAQDMREIVTEWRGGERADDRVVGTAILGTLWPGEDDVRPSTLEHYNPFAPGGLHDPGWVRRFRSGEPEPIPLGESDWLERCTERLADEGVSTISAEVDEIGSLRDACQGLVAAPIDLGYLRVYPTLAAVTHEEATLHARFEIRELA